MPVFETSAAAIRSGIMPRALPDSAHGYFIEAEGRGAQEHQEGSRGGAAEEDDLEAAEKDPHRSREAGQQGEETAGGKINCVAPSPPSADGLRPLSVAGASGRGGASRSRPARSRALRKAAAALP